MFPPKIVFMCVSLITRILLTPGVVQVHQARDRGNPTLGQGRGMDGEQKPFRDHRVTVAKTESANPGHGQDVDVRRDLVKVNT